MTMPHTAYLVIFATPLNKGHRLVGVDVWSEPPWESGYFRAGRVEYVLLTERGPTWEEAKEFLLRRLAEGIVQGVDMAPYIAAMDLAEQARIAEIRAELRETHEVQCAEEARRQEAAVKRGVV